MNYDMIVHMDDSRVLKAIFYWPAEDRHQTSIATDEVSALSTQLNFVAQFKVARLTWQLAQLLTSRATNFLDRNHLYSSSISGSAAEL